jgi:predicted signal transduction protein with EAL and GGDEF domain
VAQTGFDPRRLELEISETALVKSNDAARKIVDELLFSGDLEKRDDGTIVIPGL